ncbi:MAG: hypothetical protein KDC26_13045 [Armatimonadetes bacterium]|nr:hypothetical protein [Armatimonadota bacterium]
MSEVLKENKLLKHSVKAKLVGHRSLLAVQEFAFIAGRWAGVDTAWE